MTTVYKILLFTIVSISLPIGKLFEIFSWNNQVIKTEIVFKEQASESNGRLCYFAKIAKEIQSNLSISLQVRPDVAIIERVISNRNVRSLTNQKNKVDSIRTLLLRRFLFNLLYVDDQDVNVLFT